MLPLTGCCLGAEEGRTLAASFISSTPDVACSSQEGLESTMWGSPRATSWHPNNPIQPRCLPTQVLNQWWEGKRDEVRKVGRGETISDLKKFLTVKWL